MVRVSIPPGSRDPQAPPTRYHLPKMFTGCVCAGDSEPLLAVRLLQHQHTEGGGEDAAAGLALVGSLWIP